MIIGKILLWYLAIGLTIAIAILVMIFNEGRKEDGEEVSKECVDFFDTFEGNTSLLILIVALLEAAVWPGIVIYYVISVTKKD